MYRGQPVLLLPPVQDPVVLPLQPDTQVDGDAEVHIVHLEHLQQCRADDNFGSLVGAPGCVRVKSWRFCLVVVSWEAEVTWRSIRIRMVKVTRMSDQMVLMMISADEFDDGERDAS